MTTTTVTAVPLSQKALVQAKFDKFLVKATKLGAPRPTLLFSETYTVDDVDGQLYGDAGEFATKVRVFDATVEGEVAKLAGWTFVASLEHTPAGNLVRSIESAETLPDAYRTSEATCDHCQLLRNRNATYVLLHESGEYKQVGSTCIMDFLGVDPKNVLWLADEIDGFNEGDWHGHVAAEDIALDYVLEITAKAIHAFGWTSKKTAAEFGKTATCSYVSDYMFSRKHRAELSKKFNDIEVDPAEIAATIDWAKSLANSDNEYEFNLSVIARNGVVGGRGLGFACSMLSSYKRTVEQAAIKAARKPSEFVGAVGEKLTLSDVKVVSVREFDAYAYNGPARLLVMMTTGDDFFKLWTDAGTAFGRTALAANDTDRFNLVGTVKEHDTYKDLKSTLLTRVKVVA